MGVRIAGVGHYAPAKVLTNADLEKMLDTSDEWITTRTGMKRRHIAAPDEATSDLALAASRMALDQAGLKAAEMDCFIVATATPDYPFPATACILAAKLGQAGKPAFDIEIACSGFIYGLTVAASLVRAGVYRRVLLVGAETLSKIVDYTDRGTAILFGDGAGAVVIEAAPHDSFLASDLGSDGTTPETLYLPAGGSRYPLTPVAIAAKDDKIHMAGREVFKFAVTRMVDSSMSALARANLKPQDVSYLIPHQANRRIIDAAAQRLAMPPDKVVVNIQEYGNTSAASIPIALSEALIEGKLRADDLLVFTGFGAGLSWGAVAWRWAA
ncbi:MAG: ketoacyl-ACP synthase III [Candidatus Eremiobacteraeota bacterium]|nr:ketoacyl-ACP synthase III [Candidatus Eremiobacteraeota bacterium]